MGTMQEWLLAYTHTLQCVGEVAHGRLWHGNGDNCTSQVSLLVDTFLEETSVQLVEADIIGCWDVLQQSYTGCFMDVMSYLDELVMCLPTRHTWETLVFAVPVVREDTRCQSLQLDYVPGQPVNLGETLPPLWFCMKTASGELIWRG